MRVPCYSCFLAGGNVMCNWKSFHLMKGVEYYEIWWRGSMTARQTPNPATTTAGQHQTPNPATTTAGEPVLSASGERENEAQLERDAVDVLAAAGSTRARETTPLRTQKRRKMKRSSNMPSQMHQCKVCISTTCLILCHSCE